MREIKFRAWLPKGQRMIQVEALEFMSNGRVTVTENVTGDRFMIDQLFLRQFTGMKDKNGVEIYIGDIVASSAKSSYKLVIEFGEHEDHSGGLVYGYEFAWPSSQHCIVIGNNHETGELLS